MTDISNTNRNIRQSEISSGQSSGSAAAPDSNGLHEQAQIQWLTNKLNTHAAEDPQGFGQSVELALGSRVDKPTVNTLIDNAISGELPLPNIRFLDVGALGKGALGAYDQRNGGTILIDKSLLTDNTAIERVFFEELGHHLDAQLGPGDAAENKEVMPAASILGEPLSDTPLSAMRPENDQRLVQIHDQQIEVEHHLDSDTPRGTVDGVAEEELNISISSNNSGSESNRPNESVNHSSPVERPPAESTLDYGDLAVENPNLPSGTLQEPYDNKGPTSVATNTIEALTAVIPLHSPKNLSTASLVGISTGLRAFSSRLISTFTSGFSGHPSDILVNKKAKGPRLDTESTQVVASVIGTSRRENVTTHGNIIDSLPGGNVDQANEDFDEMNLENVSRFSSDRGEARSGNLPDGSRVTVHTSADGRTTIEITELNENGRPNRGRSRQIKYGSN